MKNWKLYLHNYKTTYSHPYIGFMFIKLHKNNSLSSWSETSLKIFKQVTTEILVPTQPTCKHWFPFPLFSSSTQVYFSTSALPTQTISQLFPLQKHFHSIPPPVIKWVNKFILFIENEGAFCSAGYYDKYGTEESFKTSFLWMKAQEYKNWSSRALVRPQPSVVLKSQVTIPDNSYYSKTIFWMSKRKKHPYFHPCELAGILAWTKLSL